MSSPALADRVTYDLFNTENIYVNIKDGVDINGLRPEILIALPLIEQLLYDFGQELVITSGLDGKHKKQSAHYTGRAIDVRRWSLKDDIIYEVKVVLQKELGEHYDVVVHSTHIHIEFDPKDTSVTLNELARFLYNV